jgi:hypothetical protein
MIFKIGFFPGGFKPNKATSATVENPNQGHKK